MFPERAIRVVQERMLEDSERRYRSLFEDSPLSIWEEDITDVIRAFDELRARGTIQLRSYLEEHPKELARIAQLIRIVDVNKGTVMLYKAESKEQLRHEYEMIRTKPPGEYMRQLLGRIADRKILRVCA